MSIQSTIHRIALSLVITGSQLAAAAEPAGRFLWVRGAVTIIAVDGESRIAAKHAAVHEGETIRTGPDGLAQLRLVDRGILSLRTDTELALKRYSFEGGSESAGSVLMYLTRGGVRSVTGLIGKINPSAYTLETPTALVGVRGTDHETYHLPLDAGDGPGLPGTYDHVHEGATVLRGSTETLEIKAGQSGFAGLAEQKPAHLDVRPPIYRAPSERVESISLQQAKLRTARTRIAVVLTSRPPEHTSGIEPWEAPPAPARTKPTPFRPMPIGSYGLGLRTPPRSALPDTNAPNPFTLLPQSTANPVWTVLDPPDAELAPIRTLSDRQLPTTP
ncbi:MAG: FecR domain-containing protein [Burkholderiales bacterium]